MKTSDTPLTCDWDIYQLGNPDDPIKCGKPATHFALASHERGFCDVHARKLGVKLEKIPVETPSKTQTDGWVDVLRPVKNDHA